MSDVINVIDYELDHLFDIRIDFDKYPICQNNISILAQILENGISKTILDGDKKPIAIVSVMLIHRGVACVHIIPSKEAHGSKQKSFISAVLRLRGEFESIAREYKLRRIETLSIDDEKHNRWMQYMGFVCDGTKQMYGLNGEDYNMWSRLWV